jgi:polar amino acid transport system permease protein
VAPLLGAGLTRAMQRRSRVPGTSATDEWTIKARPVPRPGRWIATVIVGLLIAMLVHGLVTNGTFGWGDVGHYFFTSLVLSGVRLTIFLTAVSMAVGIVIGIVVAVMRLSPNPLMANASRLYIWFFRGTPLLVQLIFWYNIGALYPKISVGIPFGPSFTSFSANHVLTTLVAALIGLSLNEGAYMAEIIRAGIMAVDGGQIEAARAIGMHHRLLLRRIVLPQAMRVVIPPTGNQVITMLKTTSLCSVLSIAELLYSVELIYQRNFETIPLLVVASLWYLLMTTVLSVGQYYLERHFGRGQTTMLSLTMQHRR